MAPTLRPLFFVFLLLITCRRSVSAPIFSEFLKPSFSASSINYLDKGGVFLYSTSSIFSATLSSESPQSPFVFSIIHSPSSTVIWSANAANPAPYTAVLSFSVNGLFISSNGSILWSTPRLTRRATSAHLLDTGNLVLLDYANSSLWQSFEYPTDTLVSSQRLQSGRYLSTLLEDYRLLVTDSDAILSWSIGEFQQFWRLSSDLNSVKDLNAQVAYMEVNESGLFLLSDTGRAVFEFNLPRAKLRMIKLETNGQLSIVSYSDNNSTLNQDLLVPSGPCDLPSSCNELEICTVKNQGAACKCPTLFATSRSGGCSPADGSTPFSSSECNISNMSQENGVDLSYRSLGSQIGYFANKFSSPVSSGGDLSSCRDICTGNCSCLGFFYSNSSESCFLIKDKIGSLLSIAEDGVLDTGIGYIKVLASPQPSSDSSGSSSSKLLPILLPSIAVFLLTIVLFFAGIQWWRRRHRKQSGKRRSRSTSSSKPSIMKDIYLGRNYPWPSPNHDLESTDGDSNSDSDDISIPGLPARFTYSDLVSASENFSIKIGSGGFGEVFKGHLSDKSVVAVKRISAGIGIHGKKEFCTEIAVIGNIHHVNLVRLRGFCAEGRRRMLVYEYMNRGSLDRSLFGTAGPVLEWQERMDIAIGAARGLAYLHFGCDQKIIHCDVKPENILLNDGGSIKISDFGLAKLISPDQSGLFTTMRGTRGYLAPEWLTNSAISDRTDVYSYGMVLLELVRGRKNRSVESSGGGSTSGGSGGGDVGYFPMAALEMHELGRYLELADRRLEGRVTEEEVGLAVKVALCCLHEDPALRPTMASVASMLDGTVEVSQPRPEALNFLRLYGRGFVDYGGSATAGEFVTGTNSSSSVVSYSYMTSQEVSGPR